MAGACGVGGVGRALGAAVDRRCSPSRGGQMTPGQPGPPMTLGLFRHLKSGARGFRLLARSSHILPPQTGHAGSSGVPVGAGHWRGSDGVSATGGAAAESRGGQITPAHDLSLHLKSGARGFRLPARLSHISPPHLGQGGASPTGAVSFSLMPGDIESSRRRGESVALGP